MKRLSNNDLIESYIHDDIKIEEGKTYLMYVRYDKEFNTYFVDFYQYGTRELEPIQKNAMQKALSNYKTTNKVERKSKSKK